MDALTLTFENVAKTQSPLALLGCPVCQLSVWSSSRFFAHHKYLPSQFKSLADVQSSTPDFLYSNNTYFSFIYCKLCIIINLLFASLVRQACFEVDSIETSFMFNEQQKFQASCQVALKFRHICILIPKCLKFLH